MPPSTAASTIGSAAGSSRTHGRSLSFPKLILPRHTLDTLRPGRPKFVYLIVHSSSSSPSPTPPPYRREIRSNRTGPRGRKPLTCRFLPAESGEPPRDAREGGGLHETFRPWRVRARCSHSGRQPDRRPGLAGNVP